MSPPPLSIPTIPSTFTERQITFVKSLSHKKVLLRERKRHTDHGVSSTPSVVLYRGGGVTLCWGYPLAGGYPISARGVPHIGYPDLDLIKGGYPNPARGIPPIWTWPGGVTPSLSGGTLTLGIPIRPGWGTPPIWTWLGIPIWIWLGYPPLDLVGVPPSCLDLARVPPPSAGPGWGTPPSGSGQGIPPSDLVGIAPPSWTWLGYPPPPPPGQVGTPLSKTVPPWLDLTGVPPPPVDRQTHVKT